MYIICGVNYITLTNMHVLTTNTGTINALYLLIYTQGGIFNMHDHHKSTIILKFNFSDHWRVN